MLAYLVFFLIFAVIYGIAVMGLNLQWGFTGLFNAGVVAFFAVGAYTTAILIGPQWATSVGGFGLPLVLGLLGAMLSAGLAALLVGLATLRLREDYLAIATFGIAVTVQLLALNLETLTGGSLGLIGLPKPLAGLFAGPFTYNLFYLSLVILIAVLVYWGLVRILHSPWGRVLAAIREDETAARALGKNIIAYRLQAFVLGCMVIGLAGGLYVVFIGAVSPFDFLPIVTFQIWTMLIVGGSGNLLGSLVGALAVWGLWALSGVSMTKLLPPSWQVQGGALQVVLIGLVLVLTLLYRPRGLLGAVRHVSRHAKVSGRS